VLKMSGATIVASAPANAEVTIKESPGAAARAAASEASAVTVQTQGSAGARIATAIAVVPQLSTDELTLRRLIQTVAERSDSEMVFRSAATRVSAGFKTNFEPAFIEKVLTRAADRVPCFENLAVNPKRAWAGLYEMTPDHHPVLGPVPHVPGFFLANGFSGHGVMHAPATGKIMSDLILKGTTDLIEASLLSLQRFAEGKLIEETAVL